MSLYDAHPLAFGKSTNIRLLEVLHNSSQNSTASIHCRLIVVPLDHAPDYLALSYVWGPEVPTKTIYVDGYALSVRQNLWKFLWHWQLSSYVGHLWIDALCIDQTRLQERNHQVALMRQIYAGADVIGVWLGQDVDEHSETLKKYLSTRYLKQPMQELPNIRKSFAHVFRNEYWDRLWIIQEFVLGRSLELWFNGFRIDCPSFFGRFSSFEKSFERSGHIVDSDDGDAIVNAKAWILSFHREHYQYGSPKAVASNLFDSMELFETFGDAKCADIRDRVYGLLGLVDPEELEEHPIPIDYTQQPFELFEQLWERLLTQLCKYEMVHEIEISWEQAAERLRTMLEISQDEWQKSKALSDVQRWREAIKAGDCDPKRTHRLVYSSLKPES